MMTISSPAFDKGATLPERFAREGKNVSPPLTIRDVPTEAESLTLIMDDPDAPHGTFTHWIAFNIHPVDQQIPEGASLLDVRHGTNGWRETRYGGPQPPSGEHRYFFRIFALDRRLNLPDGTTRHALDDAMRGHVLAEAALMGRFSAPGP